MRAGVNRKAFVKNSFVHQKAVVHQFATVIRGSYVNDACVIGPGAVLDDASLGVRCSIGPGAFLCPGTFLSSRVFVGPCVVFCNDMWPEVSKDGWNYQDVADAICVKVERGASIGANATILPGVHIGAEAVVAAGAVVDRNVPSHNLFCRDGTITTLPPIEKRRARRMRFVS